VFWTKSLPVWSCGQTRIAGLETLDHTSSWLLGIPASRVEKKGVGLHRCCCYPAFWSLHKPKCLKIGPRHNHFLTLRVVPELYCVTRYPLIHYLLGVMLKEKDNMSLPESPQRGDAVRILTELHETGLRRPA
jgi:hypothetical protein